jgi:hypothetical protein
LRYTFKVWLSLLLALTAASAYGQLPSIDPTAQIMWNLAAGIGPPTAACTQNGQYVTLPYGAQWGQHYVDQANDNSYDCGSGGWYQTNGGGVPNAQGTAPITVNGASGVPKTGAITIACPSCGTGLQAQVVPPIAGQQVTLSATSVTATSGNSQNFVASSDVNSASFTRIACGLGPPQPSCDPGAVTSTVTWSGFQLPAGVTPSSVTQIFAFAQAQIVGTNGAGAQINASLGCTSDNNLINDADSDFPLHPFSVALTTQTGSTIPAITCTASIQDSSNTIITGLTFNVNSVKIIAYYTGTQVTQPNIVNVAPCLAFNSSSSILSLDEPCDYAQATDTADAYRVTLQSFSQAVPAVGQGVLFSPPTPNTTTTPTLNLNGTGPFTITKGPGQTALAAGNISGNIAYTIFDGTNWELQNPQTSSGGGGGTVTLTGPVTGSGTGTVATTITPTGVTAGSYTNPNITINAAGQISAASNGSGGSGIGSIAWSLPSFMSASPTTISASGTQAFSFNSQSANTFLAGPATGSSAPTFRVIVAADVPTLNQPTTNTAGNITATTNSTLITLSALSLPYSQLTGVPATGVSSVFGRTNAVVAVSGDYTVAQVTGAAPLASPTFTGIPAAPTAAASTNTTQLATTAFVTAALAAAGSAAGIVTYSGPSLTFTGTAFFPIGGGGLSSTTETNVDLAAPAAATVKNFTVQLSNAPGTGNSIAFTWRDNATSTAITCTVSGSATSCSDLTHSFTASAGDLLDIRAVTSGTILSASTAVMGTQVGIASSSGVTGGALTISSGTQGANSCASVATVTDTGLTASGAFSRPTIAYSGTTSGLTGWGAASPGMKLNFFTSSANTMGYEVCNYSSSSITYSAITFQLGAS